MSRRQPHDGRARRSGDADRSSQNGRQNGRPEGRPLPASLLIGALLVALIAAGAWWWLRAPAFAIEPRADQNVLLVTIDTLRADALSSYGGVAQTPNLDALAAHGARFTFAHAHSVLTLPSHTSILTGAYPYEHGLRDNIGYRLAPGTPTLATRLKQAGYATGAFVGAFPLKGQFGLNAGFDTYDDRVGQRLAIQTFGEAERHADEVVSSATQWIDRQTGRWFAWVHVYDPHAPYAPPVEYQARYPGNPYAGEVAWTDAALGPLFDRLGAQRRPTLVVVTGDHGEALGSHGEMTHGVFAYEPTLRVPLIISGVSPQQRHAPAGLTIDAPARHIDILPTVLAALGLPAEKPLAGTSLAGLIAGRSEPDRPLYFEALMTNLERGWAPLRGVIAERWKYVDLPIPELYDLSADPGETRNLATANADRSQVLLNLLRGFNTAPPGAPLAETALVKSRLRALGYLGMSPAAAKETYGEDDDPKRLIDVDQQTQEAIKESEAGNLSGAIDILQRLIARRPDDPEAYLNLEVVLWRAGRTNEAIATLEAALKRGITRWEVRTKLGLCLALSGQGQRAIPFLEGLTADDPETMSALGLAYAQVNRPADAIREFQHVLQLDPSNAVAAGLLGTIQLEAKNYTAAEPMLRRALALDPSQAATQASLGDLLAETSRPAEAIAAWTAALALDAGQHDALCKLAITLAGAGRLDEARVYGDRYLQVASPQAESDQIAAVRRAIKR